MLTFSPERALCQAISHFQVSWAASTCALADAALIYGQTASFHLAGHLYPIRLFSNIVNGGWALWDAAELIDVFTKRAFTTNPLTTTAKFSLTAIGAFAAMGVGLFPRTRPIPPAWKIDPEILKEQTHPNGVKSQVTINLQYPNSQRIGYGIYLSRIVMNLLTAYFSPERRLLCGLNTLALTVGFFKTHQLKWLNFSRKFDFSALVPTTTTIDDYIKRKLFSYTVPLLPFIGRATESCPICLGPTPDTCFTPQEPLHYPCLVQTILNKSDHFLDNNQDFIQGTRHSRDGSYTHTSYKYIIKIPQKNLPASSTSRIYPSNHFLQLTAESLRQGKLPTEIEWIPNPDSPKTLPLLSTTLWARVGCLYSAFQTLLATLQGRHPDLAGKILSVQTVLSLFDMGALIQNFHQLYHILYEKYILLKINQNAPTLALQQAEDLLETARLNHSTQNTAETLAAFQQALNVHETTLKTHTSFRSSLEDEYRFYLLLAMGLGSIALGAASAGTVNLLNRQLRPAFNLTEMLKKVATPADLSNTHISWSTPWLPYASQCLVVSRIIMNLALAYFSPHCRTHFLSAFLQSQTSLKLAQLPWSS